MLACYDQFPETVRGDFLKQSLSQIFSKNMKLGHQMPSYCGKILLKKGKLIQSRVPLAKLYKPFLWAIFKVLMSPSCGNSEKRRPNMGYFPK